MKTELKNFVASTQRNCFFTSEQFSIYVRRSVRVLRGHPCRCFDIANVNVAEAHRGSEIFTAWLESTESALIGNAEFDAIYIESVLEQRFAEFFIRRGYLQLTSDIAPSFYALIR